VKTLAALLVMSFGFAWSGETVIDEAERALADGRHQKAIETLTRFLEAERREPLSREIRFKARTTLAKAHLRKWEPDQALQQVALAEGLAGAELVDRLLILRLCAVARHNAGDAEGARKALTKALELAKDESAAKRVDLQVQLGELELSQGRPKAARAAIVMSVIATTGSDLTVAEELKLKWLAARIRHWCGEYKKAEVGLRGILDAELGPEERARAHRALGRVLLATPEGRVSDAIAELKKAMSIYRKGPRTHSGAVSTLGSLAWAYAHRDDVASVNACVQAARKQALPAGHPVWAGVLRAEAWVLACTGKSDEARKLLARAIELESRYQAESAPGIVDSKLLLLQIELADGNKPEALRLADSCVRSIERDFGKDAGALWRPLAYVAEVLGALGREQDAAQARERMELAIRQTKRR